MSTFVQTKIKTSLPPVLSRMRMVSPKVFRSVLMALPNILRILLLLGVAYASTSVSSEQEPPISLRRDADDGPQLGKYNMPLGRGFSNKGRTNYLWILGAKYITAFCMVVLALALLVMNISTDFKVLVEGIPGLKEGLAIGTFTVTLLHITVAFYQVALYDKYTYGLESPDIEENLRDEATRRKWKNLGAMIVVYIIAGVCLSFASLSTMDAIPKILFIVCGLSALLLRVVIYGAITYGFQKQFKEPQKDPGTGEVAEEELELIGSYSEDPNALVKKTQQKTGQEDKYVVYKCPNEYPDKRNKNDQNDLVKTLNTMMSLNNRIERKSVPTRSKNENRQETQQRVKKFLTKRTTGELELHKMLCAIHKLNGGAKQDSKDLRHLRSTYQGYCSKYPEDPHSRRASEV